MENNRIMQKHRIAKRKLITIKDFIWQVSFYVRNLAKARKAKGKARYVIVGRGLIGRYRNVGEKGAILDDMDTYIPKSFSSKSKAQRVKGQIERDSFLWHRLKIKKMA